MKIIGHLNIYILFSENFWLTYVPKFGTVEHFDSYSFTHEEIFKD